MSDSKKMILFTSLLLSLKSVGFECDYGSLLRRNGTHFLMRTMSGPNFVELWRQVDAERPPRLLSASGAPLFRPGQRKSFRDRLTLLGDAQSEKWAYPLLTENQPMIQGTQLISANAWQVGLLFDPSVLNTRRFYVDSSRQPEDRARARVEGHGWRHFESTLGNGRRFEETLQWLQREDRFDREQTKEWRQLDSVPEVPGIDIMPTEPVRVYGDWESEARSTTHIHVPGGLKLDELQAVWLPRPMRNLIIDLIWEKNFGSKRRSSETSFDILKPLSGQWTYQTPTPRKDETFTPRGNQGSWYAVTPKWKEIAEKVRGTVGGAQLLTTGTLLFGFLIPD